MRILELTIQNVRGLPHLCLQLNGKNVVILGPNGAGKSCVIDAIDFLFTGRISRLIGEGTSGITLPRHGPHIDHGPESALVTATVQLEGMSQPIELSRCMAEPDELVCPDEAKAALAKTTDLMRRGGVVLTRRDILRYVAAEAGKRANDIKELLDLKDVDDVRSSLVRTRTELTRNERDSNRAIETAKAEVNVTLGLPKYSDEGLIEAINESRQTLGGGPVAAQKASLFKESLVPPAARESDPTSANTSIFLQAIKNVRGAAPSSLVPELAKYDEVMRGSIAELRANPALLAELERLDMMEHASQFVEDSTVECPVCGAPWSTGELKIHLETKIATAKAAGVVRKSITDSAEAIATPARTLRANVTAISETLRTADVDTRDEDVVALDSWLASLNGLIAAVADPLEQYLDSGLPADGVARMFVPDTLTDLLDRFEKAVQDALPQSSPELTAWDKLTRLEESVRALENRIGEAEIAKWDSKRSRVLLAEYEKARDKVLDGLYTRIADRFVEFYRVLHAHEGQQFGARLQPKRAALKFEVDFLGRGTHPPHALHSEGHQDSMGVCLFLALNEELVKGDLGLIVLDDVMMSVDTGHRKDVCRLLAEQFADCQFVITTHDRTWAKQLRYERIVDHSQIVELTGWTVEHGPNAHRQVDLWETIQAHLDLDDVNSAAFRLRRGMEEVFEDVCNALGAQITYNAGMQWQLDDWLPAAMDQYKELVRRGRGAASSWGDKDALVSFQELESIRKQIYDRTYVEQWSINASVHYNNWENMSKEDFSPVVDAFRDLQGLFMCSTCGGLLEKMPRKGTLQAAKCPCGTVYWNLSPKSGTG